MAHRGRLNLLTGLLGVSPTKIFSKLLGKSELPNQAVFTADVLSHLVASGEIETLAGKTHVTLLPNPSHLEAINPVGLGFVRSSIDKGVDTLCIQIHGDGAFSGQGTIMETLLLANIPGYTVNGSIHVITNNQLGFTALGNRDGRSSHYCSDVAKMISAPIIHVNGDSPLHVVKAMNLAFEYRQQFKKDVFIDLVCFRKYGHNELDEPSFTQPLMYKAIRARDSIPKRFIQNHSELQSLMTKLSQEYYQYLDHCLGEASKDKEQESKVLHLNSFYKFYRSTVFKETGHYHQ